MPVTQSGGKLAGLSEMGGLWEWTSSPLKRVEGFEPMKLYPAYSGSSKSLWINVTVTNMQQTIFTMTSTTSFLADLGRRIQGFQDGILCKLLL